MKFHGILFKPELSKASEEGRKTETRRIMTPKTKLKEVGDIFYERENHWKVSGGKVSFGDGFTHSYSAGHFFHFKDFAGFAPVEKRKMSKLHMPSWAARKFYRILEVGIEPLQNITESSACNEMGIISSLTPIGGFAELWDGINKDRGYCWNDNPLVIVYRYEKYFKDQWDEETKQAWKENLERIEANKK